MIGCREVREDLPRLVSALETVHRSDGLEEHLLQCAPCARERATLASALEQLREPIPGEDAMDWDAIARRTVRRALSSDESLRIEAEARKGLVVPFRRYRIGGFFAPRGVRIAVAGAGAAAVALAVYIGSGHVPGVRPGQEGVGRVNAAELLRAVDAITTRAQVVAALSEGRELLWSLEAPASSQAAGGISLVREKAACRRLLERSRLLDARLGGSEAERAAGVWQELREVLFELSALPDTVPRTDLERMQQALVRQDLLTRLDVVISELGWAGVGGPGGDA